VWKRRRAAFLRKHGPYCDACYVRKRLDVHHAVYEDEGYGFGQEADETLRVLCRKCHHLVHRYFDSGRYETLQGATWAAIRDARKHRKRAKARRAKVKRWVRRLMRSA